MSRDSLYAQPQDMIVDFVFNESVAAVFPDMIRRSVPAYAEIITLSGLLAEQYVQPYTRCYDLGCSLGATTLSMRRRIRQPGARIVAVDSSAAMLERCRANIEADPATIPVELICADIRKVAVADASVAAINFTLQFVPPRERLALLSRIAQGMRPGGVLILSEKVDFEHEREQRFHEQMHRAFKRANGYSELEISQKRAALERVLLPDTVTEHRERLLAAGFRDIQIWFQCFNFVSLMAFR